MLVGQQHCGGALMPIECLLNKALRRLCTATLIINACHRIETLQHNQLGNQHYPATAEASLA